MAPRDRRDEPSAVGVYERPSRWRQPGTWVAIAVAVAAVAGGIALLAS